MPSVRIFPLICISLGMAAFSYQLAGSPSQKSAELGSIEKSTKTIGVLPSPIAESRGWGILATPSTKQIAPAGLGATAVLFFVGKKMRHRRQIRRKLQRIRGF
jgi:hypothetical protein